MAGARCRRLPLAGLEFARQGSHQTAPPTYQELPRLPWQTPEEICAAAATQAVRVLGLNQRQLSLGKAAVYAPGIFS